MCGESRSTLHERARAALAGRSSREVGRKKDLAAARWIYRWGWSSPSTVDLVASPGRRGIAARLVKKGWAVRHPTPQGGGQKGVAAEVLVLTPDGVAEVEAELAESALLPYPARPDQAIPWHQLRHDGLVQLWTARKIAAGQIVEYRTPRELAARSSPGVKQPDAVWVWRRDGLTLAVELELTAKRDRELHQAVLAILRAVHPESGPYDTAAILSHSPAILDRYRRLLRPGAPITTYTRDAARHWRASGQVRVPDWAAGRVLLEQVALW